jgi:mitogen-activated protein kinase 1/3
MVNPEQRNVAFGGGVGQIPSMFADWKTPERYELRNSIGTGSYGHVAEAFDKKTQRLVAIKRCTRVFEDLIDCKRILREVAILSQLKHTTVVGLYDFVVPEPHDEFDELYMVLEICDSDFKKLARTPVFLTELHILTIFYNLLAGLEYLKRSGIYHRDLKPANCLVNQNCAVKICDFGLSRAVHIEQPNLGGLPETPRGEEEKKGTIGHTEKMKRALTGHVVTRWYRAPELILLETNYTEQIDMWSAGCILSELLGLMKENVQHPQDRGPIFPGQSCFPLSPDNKQSKKFSRGNRDQLKMIFDVIGTPTDEEIDALARDAAAYVRKQYPPKAGEDLSKRFPGSSPATLDLMQKCLVFDPAKRMKVEEAVKHEAFKGVQSNAADNMPDGTQQVELEFEQEPDLNEKALRKWFLFYADKYKAMQ